MTLGRVDSFSSGARALVSMNTLVTLTLNILLHFSRVGMESGSSRPAMPALLTRMSSLPNSCWMLSTQEVMEASDVTSIWIGSTLLGDPRVLIADEPFSRLRQPRRI